jgi:condensin complex subunit 2
MENLPSFINQSIEASWQKASASLDASAKIYGYRVDSVHTETFKFLGGLNRAEQRSEENEAKTNDEKKKLKKISSNGEATLEKDLSKINVDKFDLTFDVDALFKMMTAKFSDSGARGLILKSLPLDENLDILLESNAINNYNIGKKRNSHDNRKMSNNKTLTAVIESNSSN